MSSMPQPMRRDQDETNPDDVVVGVDTHKNTHTAAVITHLGALLVSEALSREPLVDDPTFLTVRVSTPHWSGRDAAVPVLRSGGVRSVGQQSWSSVCARRVWWA